MDRWLSIISVLASCATSQPGAAQTRPNWSVVPRTDLWNVPTAVTGGAKNRATAMVACGAVGRPLIAVSVDGYNPPDEGVLVSAGEAMAGAPAACAASAEASRGDHQAMLDRLVATVLTEAQEPGRSAGGTAARPSDGFIEDVLRSTSAYPDIIVDFSLLDCDGLPDRGPCNAKPGDACTAAIFPVRTTMSSATPAGRDLPCGIPRSLR